MLVQLRMGDCLAKQEIERLRNSYAFLFFDEHWMPVEKITYIGLDLTPHYMRYGRLRQRSDYDSASSSSDDSE